MCLHMATVLSCESSCDRILDLCCSKDGFRACVLLVSVSSRLHPIMKTFPPIQGLPAQFNPTTAPYGFELRYSESKFTSYRSTLCLFWEFFILCSWMKSFFSDLRRLLHVIHKPHPSLFISPHTYLFPSKGPQ